MKLISGFLNHKFLIIGSLLLFTVSTFAQSPPQGFNYQAVARDGNGALITNKNIKIQPNIRKSTVSGSVVWREEHTVTTNQFGLFTLVIGKGVRTGGTLNNFADIAWESDRYFLEVEMDAGEGYQSMGTSQLVSVPYALTAGRVDSASHADRATVADSAISGGLQQIHTNNRLSGDGTSGNPLDLADQGAANGQVLKWDGNNWSPAEDRDSVTTDTSNWHRNGNHVYLNNDDSIGIGTATPYTKLHVDSGTVLFGDSLEGGEPRMAWIPQKSALRAGNPNGSPNWDLDSTGSYSFATGQETKASGWASTAMGGYTTASGSFGTALGFSSSASGHSSTAIGAGATVSGIRSTAIGESTTVSGSNSTAIGYKTTVDANVSTIIGNNAKLTGEGSMYLTDHSVSGVSATTKSNNNRFYARFANGYYLYSNAAETSGVYLNPGGGSWNSPSDKNLKENISNVQPEHILNKVGQLDIKSWNYKTQDESIRHIGPFAQDFYRQFGFGHSDTTINTIDIDGVNMVAIQALKKRTEELKETNEKLGSENQALKERLDRIEGALKEAGIELKSSDSASLTENEK